MKLVSKTHRLWFFSLYATTEFPLSPRVLSVSDDNADPAKVNKPNVNELHRKYTVGEDVVEYAGHILMKYDDNDPFKWATAVVAGIQDAWEDYSGDELPDYVSYNYTLQRWEWSLYEGQEQEEQLPLLPAVTGEA